MNNKNPKVNIPIPIFEPTVLYFLCGENTAVGSVALTVRRTVIHYHLTLRLIRPVGLITLDIA